ncbi:MAG TPA: hypothetical protein DIW24_08810, partial [Bacteroidetes bacterium]|nr:hypothetical protein [Bacteroidota bacterium]
IHHVTGTGLRVFEGDYINVIGNEVHNCSRRSSVGNHGLVFHSSKSIDTSNATKIYISRNKVHHNYNEVYSWSELKTFITPHIDEGKGISMQKNSIANGWTHGRIQIENNVTYLNGFSGVHINEGLRMDIVNNTAYNNSYTGTGNNIGISVQDGEDITIRNNISVAPTNFNGFAISIGGTTSNVIVHKNLIQGLLDNDLDVNTTATMIAADVMFTNAASFDFSLQASSPAINGADSAFAPQKDYLNTTRDTNPDFGAIEYLAPLSILISHFTVRVTSNTQVIAEWRMHQNGSGDRFVLERSQNQLNWKTVSSVLVEARQDAAPTYVLQDPKPIKGHSWYRIRHLNSSGNSSVSQSQEVILDRLSFDIQVYPNPAQPQGGLSIENGMPEAVDFTLYDALGRKVKTFILTDFSQLPLTGLSSGLYIWVAQTGFKTMKGKVIIQ